MDLDILRIAAWRPGGVGEEGAAAGGAGQARVAKRSRLEVLADARLARSRKCEARREEAAQAQAHTAAVFSFGIAGCAALVPAAARSHAVRLEAVQRLAFTPKIRGSGAAVERVRHLQNRSATRVGSLTLRCQRQGLQL